MLPSVTIPLFDRFLYGRGLRLEAVAIGGTALNLLGVIRRETRDCDILVPELEERIRTAARAFAQERRAAGDTLQDDWLNNGPSTLTQSLPGGWEARLEPLFTGQALLLSVLGRGDLLKTKLFAFCDRRTDLPDCIALAPSADELAEALPWVQHQDAHQDWPAYVVSLFAELGRRLGHGV